MTYNEYYNEKIEEHKDFLSHLIISDVFSLYTLSIVD